MGGVVSCVLVSKLCLAILSLAKYLADVVFIRRTLVGGAAKSLREYAINRSVAILCNMSYYK